MIRKPDFPPSEEGYYEQPAPLLAPIGAKRGGDLAIKQRKQTQNGHQQTVTTKEPLDTDREALLAHLVASSEIPLEVPLIDVPYVPPVTSGEKLGQLDVPTVIDAYRHEEAGDAMLFAELYQGRVCYDHREKQWYLWSGHYWEADEIGQVKILVHYQLAAQYMLAAGSLKQQAGTPRDKNPYAHLFPNADGNNDLSKQIEDLIESLYKRAKSLRFKSRRDNILNTAKSIKTETINMTVRNEDWDSNPWLLGLENGVLNLNCDGTCFRNGQPSDWIRTIAPTKWEGFPCDSLMTWFIPSLFDNKPEAEKQAITTYLRKLFGYGLTGLTREDTFAILWGDEGRNGKDTLLKMIEQVLGPQLAGPVDKGVIIDGRKRQGGSASSHIMALRGKRIVWVNETKEGEVLSAGQVKYLTGGGTITGRELFQKQTTFEASHLLLLLTNFKPHANADDKALWERISLIPFDLRFVAEPKASNERLRNTELKGKLTEEQKSGVLAYFVRGCLEWQRDGLLLPDSLKAAKQIYHEEEDTLGRFVADCCVTGRRFKVSSTDLYNAYLEWSEDEGKKSPLNRHLFGRKIGKRFQRIKSNGRKVYSGVKLKEDAEQRSKEGLNW